MIQWLADVRKMMNRSKWGVFKAVPIALLVAACQPADQGTVRTESLSDALLADVQKYEDLSVADLMSSPAALRVGEQVFEAYCGGCHGTEAAGRGGAIDLKRHVFNYGVSEEAIANTVSHGRLSDMPGMGSGLGEVDIGQIVDFVQSLEFESPLSSYAERGKALFAEKCASCHGAGGQGVGELGASNLTDNYWQHGDSMMNIRLVITRGVQSECPGFFANPISAEEELLTAYVLSSFGRD